MSWNEKLAEKKFIALQLAYILLFTQEMRMRNESKKEKETEQELEEETG